MTPINEKYKEFSWYNSNCMDEKTGHLKIKAKIEEEIKKFSKIHEDTNNFLFISGPIVTDLLLELYEKIKSVKNNNDAVYVVVNSFGGFPGEAYNIIKFIRASFKKVYGIVPLHANSAATLISLGFDKIYFSSLGEMSPLDVQIYKKSEGDNPTRLSALDHTSSITEILSIAFDTFVKHYERMPKDLREMDKIKLASDYSTKLVEPLLNQVGPLELGNVARTNKIAIDYGKRILKRYKNWDEKKATDFMDKIVHYYPSHSSIIDEHELKNLGYDDVETIDYKEINFHVFYELLWGKGIFVKHYSFAKDVNKAKDVKKKKK